MFSFGGYLSAAYALRHPGVLEHIILVDPWGLPQQPAQLAPRRTFPFWVKAILLVLRHFNPLWGLR
jgi:pimeloyl-ACP methyl ester carboxylesterase